MKLADRTVEVHSVGINGTNQFTISQNAKMFNILSNSLYSDKIQAVIRELACNANDAHIAAGNKNPFLVKLPTSADPNFTVRDYGTGLSKKDMENLYTTYGASNKNDSNDFVGCLGLGSKSPFAYTKSFSTTSYFDGKQYTYIAAMDEAGVPTLNLIHSTDTNEPNGLEISFAVKQYDFHEFSQKAIRIFHFFKNKPIITGGVHYDFATEYSQRNVIIDGDGWRVCRLNNDNVKFPNNYHRIQSGVIAIMGNIAYPVEVSHLIGEEKAETPDHIAKWNRAFNKADIASWKAFVGEIINQGLYLELEFNIGELEMEVSREGLQYTKAVVRSLREKTQDIFLELKQNFTDKISAAKTKIEAITAYYQMNDLAGGWGVGAVWTDSDGKSHSINSGEDIEYKLDKSENIYVFNYRSSGYRSRRLVYLTDRIHNDTLNGRGQHYWNNSKKNGKLSFFWCDISAVETAKKIVTKYCNENDCFGYLLVNTLDHTSVKNNFTNLVNDVGSSNIVNVSDYRDLIKSAPKNKATKGSKGSVSDQDIFLIWGDSTSTSKLSYEYNDAEYLRSLSAERLNDLDDEDEIVYMPIVRYASTEDYPAISSICSFEPTIKDNDLFNGKNIYAIKKSSVDRLKKDGYNLVDFNSWFKNRLKEIDSVNFKKIRDINSVIEYCKKEYNTEDRMEKPYEYGSIDRVFLYHILNIFGLDYSKFITDKDTVNMIDSLMVTAFFADTIHREGYNLVKFKQNDYYSHIATLLNNIGINGLDIKKIKSSNLLFNIMNNLLDSWYNETSGSYKKLIKAKSDNANTYSIPKTKELRDTIKKTLDSNPLLKYIMCVKPVDGDLKNLRDVNPIKQLDNGRGYYYRDESNYYNSMNNVELFRDQISKIFG